MKNIILASALAVASILPFAGVSQAQSITITTNDGRMHDGRPGWHRERPRYVQENYRHGPRHACRTKQVKSYHHGKLVVKTTKVCN